MVTGGDDGVARVWQVKPTKQLTVLRGHTLGVNRARLSPNGSQVATVSDDGSGRLWPARLQAPIAPRWQWADSTAFSPRSPDVLVVRHGSKASESGVWNVGTGTMVPLLGGVTVPSVRDHRHVALRPSGRLLGRGAPDGRFVAGVNAARRAVIWDAGTGEARPIPSRPRTPWALRSARTAAVSSFLAPISGGQGFGTSRPGSPGSWCRPCPADTRLFSAQFVPNSRWPLDRRHLHAAHSSSDPATGETPVLLSGQVLPAGVAVAEDGRRIASPSARSAANSSSSRVTGRSSALGARGAERHREQHRLRRRPARQIVTGGLRGTAVNSGMLRTLDAEGTARRQAPKVSGVAVGGSDGNLVLVTAGTKCNALGQDVAASRPPSFHAPPTCASSSARTGEPDCARRRDASRDPSLPLRVRRSTTWSSEPAGCSRSS